MSHTTPPLFAVQDLRLEYRTRTGERIHAVDSVSFTLREGSILGIAGESGCGKSTLVSGCMGLYLPPLYRTGGSVTLNGKELTSLNAEQLRRQVLGKQISMIPQGALNSLNPTRTVADLATDMVRSHGTSAGKAEIMDRLGERFTRIGIDPRRVARCYPIALSGGMKQRVVIGISTLLDPDVVIADEPTSALDVSTQKAVIELLFDLLDSGIVKSMIIITHELPLLRHVADTTAIMYAGECVEIGPTAEVIMHPRHPYTRALMQSTLTPETTSLSKTVTLPGAPPGLETLPRGCRFAERCPVAHPDCRHEPPDLRTIGERAVRCPYA